MCPFFGLFFVSTFFAAVREPFDHVHPDKEVKKVRQNLD
jgi:hypothetical protein